MQLDRDSVPKLNPFLKWAGSKRKLLTQILPFVPPKFGKYFEPFLGGGALFFALSPESAEISDASGALISTYKAVKKDVDAVLDFIEPLNLNKEEFGRIKKGKYIKSTSKAGAFIYLNKTCWNGLYRVNSKGQFNVPYGRPRSDFIVDPEALRDCSRQLRRRSVSIKHQDFEKIEDSVNEGDFVYLDPPYVTSHNINGFVDWNEKLFSWDDQFRLVEMARRLAKRGANVLITNADHPSVHELYKGFGKHQITRFSSLASDITKRRLTTEAVFYSGPLYEGSSFELKTKKFFANNLGRVLN